MIVSNIILYHRNMFRLIFTFRMFDQIESIVFFVYFLEYSEENNIKYTDILSNTLHLSLLKLFFFTSAVLLRS